MLKANEASIFAYIKRMHATYFGGVAGKFEIDFVDATETVSNESGEPCHIAVLSPQDCLPDIVQVCATEREGEMEMRT
jgi:hypothetical protein